MLLPFLILVFGVVEFGVAINRHTMLNNATREGGREGVFNPVEDDVRTVVQNSLVAWVPVADDDIVVECFALHADPDTSTPTGCGDDAVSGGTIRVHVTAPNRFITFVPRAIGMGDEIALASEIRMRIE